MTSTQIRKELIQPWRGAFAISDVTLRQSVVPGMREKGWCVISSNIPGSRGFFVPLAEEEILNFMRTQASRVRAVRKTIKGCAKFLPQPEQALRKLGLGVYD